MVVIHNTTRNCAKCGGSLGEDWSEDAAILEMQHDYPGFREDDRDATCDSCYAILLKIAEALVSKL